MGILSRAKHNLTIVLVALGIFAILVIAFVGYSLARTYLASPRQITATVILERIQALSELSTVRYNFSSIITTTRDMPPVLGIFYGENQAMVAVGHVRAGVDLSQMSEEEISYDEDKLTIQLPRQHYKIAS